MTIGISPLMALALAGLAPTSAPSPAPPQDDARNMADCDDESRQTPAETIVAACTALLESGRLDARERSLALSGRAIGYRVQRDYPRAIADYEEALRIDPDYAWAHAGLGASYRDSGEFQRGREEYDIALRLSERELAAEQDRAMRATLLYRSAFGYYGRGLALEGLGDRRSALADFREAFRRTPTEPNFGNALCWSLAVLGEELDEARAACDASLRLRPDHPPTLDSRGLVALKQGRFQDAWDDYDAAARINPDGPSWVYGRGIAALRLGRTEEGRADLARAEALSAGVAQSYADFGIRP